MSLRRKTILFEANEIPFPVLDRYVKQKPSSNVARLLRSGKQMETICEDQIELDPWISWPTLHRGVIDEQHGILHLGQDIEASNKAFPAVWDVLSNNGVSVGLMGSLHTSTIPPNAKDYAFYVPDFFAETVFAHPKGLRAFQAFNLAMTRKSSRNVDGGVALREAAEFLLQYVRQGMSVSTIKSVLGVLANELRKPHLKSRRRALQPLITLDLFLHFMAKKAPEFATLHTNHVAAAMHRYWAAAFPNDLPTNHMPLDWRKKYEGEIEFSMDVLDTMLGRLMGFVDRDPSYKLVLVSSLGQAAIATKPSPGFASITDVGRLMQTLGVPADAWTERFAMAPIVGVMLNSKEEADALEAKLRQISVGEHAVKQTKREVAPLSFDRNENTFQIYFYFEAYEGDWTAQYAGREVSFESLGMGWRPNEDGVCCSARHTPDGILIVYDPKQPAVDATRARVSTLDIAPALLEAHGVVARPYMKTPDPTMLDTAKSGVQRPLVVRGGGLETIVQRAAS